MLLFGSLASELCTLSYQFKTVSAVLSFRLRPNTESLLFQVIEILLKWHGSIKQLLEAIVFPFPPSFLLKSGKFIVTKCLFGFPVSSEKARQTLFTGICEAFLKYWFLTPCEPFCLRNAGNCHPSGFFSEAALSCIRKIFWPDSSSHLTCCTMYLLWVQHWDHLTVQDTLHYLFSSVSLFFSSGDILLAPQGWCHLICIPIRRGLCWKYLTVGWVRSRAPASLPPME